MPIAGAESPLTEPVAVQRDAWGEVYVWWRVLPEGIGVWRWRQVHCDGTGRISAGWDVYGDLIVVALDAWDDGRRMARIARRFARRRGLGFPPDTSLGVGTQALGSPAKSEPSSAPGR